MVERSAWMFQLICLARNVWIESCCACLVKHRFVVNLKQQDTPFRLSSYAGRQEEQKIASPCLHYLDCLPSWKKFKFKYAAFSFFLEKKECFSWSALWIFMCQFIVLISGECCVVSHKMMEHVGDLGKLTGV